MTWAIQTLQLTKQFTSSPGWLGPLSPRQKLRPAVHCVDLSIRQGELFGLLGPNGAGKTTLIKMLATLIIPTSGTARVNGYPLENDAAIKSTTSLVTSDERSFFWRLSGRENLQFFASLYGLAEDRAAQRVEEVLGLVDLQDAAARSFQTYSTGMRQRLCIARALLPNPRLMFLDEPTKGLDPTATRNLQRLIRQDLVDRLGITVLLTTHDLVEAETLCDRLAVMHLGELRGSGSIAELRQTLQLGERYLIRVQGLNLLKAQLEYPWIVPIHPVTAPIVPAEPAWSGSFDGGDIELELEASRVESLVRSNGGGPMGLDPLIDVLRSYGGRVRSIACEQASLEKVFDRLLEEGRLPAAAANDRMSLEPEPSPPQPLIHRPSFLRYAKAFLKKDYRNEASYRVAFLFQFFSVFISALAFYFLSRLIGGVPLPFLESYGGSFFAFVLIGLAFSSYFGTGLTSFSSTLRQAQTTGTLEAMLATPTQVSTIIICSAMWDYLVTTLRVVAYLVVGALLMGFNVLQGNYLGALLLLALTVIAFSSMGILAASFIMVLKRGDPVNWMINSVSMLLGGVYYPVSILPGWMQFFSYLLPVTYALHGMRLALIKGESLAGLAPDLLALALFSVLLLPLSLFAFRYAVRQARVDGSLAHY